MTQVTLILLGFLYLFRSVLSQNCTFNVHYVTKTSSFPTNCSQLIGRFRIDENSEISNDQLVALFKNVHSIRGVLQIWNTQLTSATFMRNIQNITGDPLGLKLKEYSIYFLIQIYFRQRNIHPQ